MKKSLISPVISLLVLCLPLSLHAQEGDLSAPTEAMTEVVDETVEEATAIEIAEYAAPQSGSLGLRSSRELQLPDNMWQKISPEQAVTFISELPAGTTSATLQNLMLRVLIAETGRSDYGDTVLAARIDKLKEMGQVKLASKLLDAVPEAMLPFALKQKKFLLKTLAARKNDAQCEVASAQQSDAPHAFWHRMKVICQAQDKKTAEAQLGLDLLREQNNAPESFDELVQGLLSDGKPKIAEDALEAVETEQFVWHKLAGLAPVKSEGAEFPEIPNDDSPRVPSSLLKVKADAEDAGKRKALLASQIRHVWQKSISPENEEQLQSVQYQANLQEISPVWRSRVESLIENGEQMKALLTLIKPFTQPLSSYTISDLGFLMQEMKALGLANDATALAEEVLGGE